MQAQVTPVDLTCLERWVSAPFTQQRLHSFSDLPVKCRPPPKLVGAVLHQKSLSPEPYLKRGRVNKAHRGNIIFTKAHCERQPPPARLRWRVSREPNKKMAEHIPCDRIYYLLSHVVTDIKQRGLLFALTAFHHIENTGADRASCCLRMCSVSAAHLLTSESTSPSANNDSRLWLWFNNCKNGYIKKKQLDVKMRSWQWWRGAAMRGSTSKNETLRNIQPTR